MEHFILAADTGSDFFTNTPLGTALAALMKIIAILVVLATVVKAVKDVAAGKAGKAAGLVIGAVVLVAFLWDPSLITKLIDLGSNLVDDGLKTVDDTTGGAGGGGTGTPTAPAR